MKRDAKQILTEWLVLQAQAGSEQAFSELYGLWRRDLVRLAQIETGRAADAEEVAQDAWVAIAKGIHHLEDPATFPCWAFRILNRRCIDWIRRRQSDRRRQEILAANTASRAVDPPPQQGADAVATLSEAVASLDADGRKLLQLFYETGLSAREIATALSIPAGTVKSRLYHLREKLKRILERNENE